MKMGELYRALAWLQTAQESIIYYGIVEVMSGLTLSGTQFDDLFLGGFNHMFQQIRN
jgi:hypothetical protein